MRDVKISSEWITLGQLLKMENIAGSGGEAKAMILSGLVSVNGDVCTQRGKKLRPGDRITVNVEAGIECTIQ